MLTRDKFAHPRSSMSASTTSGSKVALFHPERQSEQSILVASTHVVREANVERSQSECVHRDSVVRADKEGAMPAVLPLVFVSLAKAIHAAHRVLPKLFGVLRPHSAAMPVALRKSALPIRAESQRRPEAKCVILLPNAEKEPPAKPQRVVGANRAAGPGKRVTVERPVRRRVESVPLVVAPPVGRGCSSNAETEALYHQRVRQIDVLVHPEKNDPIGRLPKPASLPNDKL